jgi:anti-sigma regulatory factor (Ser/Thr protein kinase)
VQHQPDPRRTQTELRGAHWSFPALAHAVGEARQVTRTWAAGQGADAQIEDAIALCVSEAFTNAVLHAFRDRPRPGTVEIEATVRDQDVSITVRDDGSGFRPRIDSPGLGLGMPLMTTLADHLEVDRLRHGGTAITLRFALA